MERKTRNLLAMASLILTMPTIAQEKVEVNVGADVVSSYIWRGQDLSNVSIQPTLSIGYKGFTLTGWGSTGLSRKDTKEFDLTLGYALKGFSISLTDYWFNNGPGYFHYNAGNTAHVFEAQIGYDFSVLSVNWYTNFAGNDGVNKNGDRAYASYFNLTAPFSLGGLEWSASIGATPWANTFYNGGANGFEVTDISIGAAKELRVTDIYSISFFAKAIWNPATEGAYFVFGTGF